MSIYSPEQWQEIALLSLNAAKSLHTLNHFRDCANRAYYAAYQAATSVCVSHGDAVDFPSGWHNPSHEQLPALIKKNGDLSRKARQKIIASLRSLRSAREDADYKPGQTVDESTALACLREAERVFAYLGVENKW